MSYENVKKYFENIGLQDHITVRGEIGDTVERAAGGNDYTAVRLTMEELIEHSHMAGWADVCKGCLANE